MSKQNEENNAYQTKKLVFLLKPNLYKYDLRIH